MSKNVTGHYADHVSSWRRTAIASWRPANDPTIYGTLAVDATRALEYLQGFAGGPHHVTMTHLVAKAVADTLALHPECNAYVRRGRIFVREEIDVFVLAAVPPSGTSAHDELDADLTGVKICRANEKTLVQIAEEVSSRVDQVRHGTDADLARSKRLLDALPPFLLKPALGLITFLQYETNVDLTALGVPRDPFGGAFVTSLGMLGIQNAFAPIVPMTRLAVNVAVGRVADAPVAEDGKVVVRPVLTMTATFDHRVIDGYHAGRLGETFTSILRSPADHLSVA